MGKIKLVPGINAVIDAFWGSSGKGKNCAWMGHLGPDLVCSSFGPNAGHTFISDEGKKVVNITIPSSANTTDCPILVMADSVIILEDFLKEIEPYGDRVKVHPRVAIVSKEDSNNAKKTGHHLAGTMKGTGHAIARKILRIEGTKLARDILPSHMIADTCEMVQDACFSGKKVLFEMSQGFDLSVNHGHDYPYLTSRDVTAGSILNSAGVAPKYMGQLCGNLRTFPIRVGNIDGGFSGPHYPDQQEMTWQEVTDHMGSSDLVQEITTVTKRVRRVFSFSFMQLEKFIRYNSPDWLFLNFAQYLDIKSTGAKSVDELTEPVMDFIDSINKQIYSTYGCRIALVGTGAADDEIVEL